MDSYDRVVIQELLDRVGVLERQVDTLRRGEQQHPQQPSTNRVQEERNFHLPQSESRFFDMSLPNHPAFGGAQDQPQRQLSLTPGAPSGGGAQMGQSYDTDNPFLSRAAPGVDQRAENRPMYPPPPPTGRDRSRSPSDAAAAQQPASYRPRSPLSQQQQHELHFPRSTSSPYVSPYMDPRFRTGTGTGIGIGTGTSNTSARTAYPAINSSRRSRIQDHYKCGYCGQDHDTAQCAKKDKRCLCAQHPKHLAVDCRIPCTHCAKVTNRPVSHFAMQCKIRCAFCGDFRHPAIECRYMFTRPKGTCYCGRPQHLGQDHMKDGKVCTFLSPGAAHCCGRYFCTAHGDDPALSKIELIR